MKKLLTILGSLGMIVPVSASVVACNSSNDKETLRSSDHWGDDWDNGDPNDEPNGSDRDEEDEEGGRWDNDRDEEDEEGGRWDNDRDEDNNENEDNENHDDLMKTDFGNLSFNKLEKLLVKERQQLFKSWCKFHNSGDQTPSEEDIDNHPELIPSYSQIIFRNTIIQAKVFIETSFIVEYHSAAPDIFFLNTLEKRKESYPYSHWAGCAIGFSERNMFKPLLKFYNSEQKQYLNWCLKELAKIEESGQ